MKARVSSYSRDPNRWLGQRARWKPHWESRDARRRRRRPPEQNKCSQNHEPRRKAHGKVQIWETPPRVQIDGVNRARLVGNGRHVIVDVLNVSRVTVRTTVVHFLRYECVAFLDPGQQRVVGKMCRVRAKDLNSHG